MEYAELGRSEPGRDEKAQRGEERERISLEERKKERKRKRKKKKNL